VTTKFVTLLPVPPDVVILMGECAKPLGTTAVNCVSESIVKLVAAMEPKFTLVAPVNPDPITVTVVPTGPDVGEKEVIEGTGGGPDPIVNTVGLWATPLGVVTDTNPVVAPTGTVVVI
jgi:hypothetical protein